jgi:hypothetical protein
MWEQQLKSRRFQLPPYWISGRRMTSDFLGDGIVENTDPENGGGVGRHRVCVSSWSLGDVRGGGCIVKLTLQKGSRCSRVKKLTRHILWQLSTRTRFVTASEIQENAACIHLVSFIVSILVRFLVYGELECNAIQIIH